MRQRRALDFRPHLSLQVCIDELADGGLRDVGLRAENERGVAQGKHLAEACGNRGSNSTRTRALPQSKVDFPAIALQKGAIVPCC